MHSSLCNIQQTNESIFNNEPNIYLSYNYNNYDELDYNSKEPDENAEMFVDTSFPSTSFFKIESNNSNYCSTSLNYSNLLTENNIEQKDNFNKNSGFLTPPVELPNNLKNELLNHSSFDHDTINECQKECTLK